MADSNVSVALLLSDLNEVKILSGVFRKLGIVPHFYEDLKTFWEGTLERLPNLCVIDVKLMSEGSLVLKDHPAVIAEEMPLVFYYSSTTEPLMFSTQHFYNLGAIKQGENYEGNLKAILKRVNKITSLEHKLHAVNLTSLARFEYINKLESQLEVEKKTDLYQNIVKSFCVELENHRGSMELFDAVEKLFEGIDEIEEFSFLELAPNSQKLISPLSYSKKFRSIPAIHLGQVSVNGIEVFAQNLGMKTVIETLGGELVALNIKGHKGRVEKLLFVKTNSELFYNQFDWNLFEAYLNGYYASMEKNAFLEDARSHKIFSIHEAMSYIDQYLFGRMVDDKLDAKIEDIRLVNIDLTSLTKLVLKKGTTRFFWNRFIDDFIAKFEIHTRVSFRYFEHGINHIGFLVKARDLDLFFDQLKDYSARFQYWKYFEDSDTILTQVVQPTVSMSALSAHAYLTKVMESDSLVFEQHLRPRVQEVKPWTFVDPKNNLSM